MYYDKLSDLGIKLTRRYGQEKTKCPQCSDGRKNKNDKPLSVSITTGDYRCHNCGWKGNVRSFTPKREFKNYEKPPADVLKNIELKENVVKWFADRAISRETLDKFKIFVKKEWMPQTQKEENCVCFPYFKNGDLANIKYRDGAKNFKMHKGAELIFYNLNSIGEKRSCVIVEGECFHPSVQVLTSDGWVRFDEWDGQSVAQYNDDATISFVKPLAKVEKQFDGELIEYSNNQKFYSLTTPEHNLVFNFNSEVVKRKAFDMPDDGKYSIPRVAYHNGAGLYLSDDEIRLCVAVSADFSIRKEGDLYCCLKKERKKERLCGILDRLGIKYSLNIDSRGYYSFFIRRGDAPNYVFKIFPNEWIWLTSLQQKKLIIDEILYWDGNSVSNRSQIEYSTKEYSNATFIQTISSLCGFCSTIISRKNDLGKWYKVSILFTKTSTSSQSLSSKARKVRYSGLVHCLTVPSGMLLVRQNDCISVSGNCDTMAVYEAGIGHDVDTSTGEVVEDEFSKYAIVSVPNGASSGNQKLEYLDNCAEWFVALDEIIVATDGDEAGENLKNELIRRLGVERCKVVSYPMEELVPNKNGGKRRPKDMNEVLQYFGADVVKNMIRNADSIPVEGIYEVDDLFPTMLENFKRGVQLAPSTRMPQTDEYWRWKKGDINLITGYANAGKTNYIIQMMLIKSIWDGWKWAVFCPENYPANDFYDDLVEMYVGKWLNQMTEQEYTDACHFLSKHIFYVYPENEHDIHSIHEKFRYLVMKKGIDGVLIDPFNQLDHNQKAYQREDQYLSEVLKDIKRFALLNAVVYNIVAHPKNPRYEEGRTLPPVDMYDIAGGAMWGNKVDLILSYFRPNQIEKNSPEVRIYVQKVKRIRTGGKKGEFDLTFLWGKKRYAETSGYIGCDPHLAARELKRQQTNYSQQEIIIQENLENKNTGSSFESRTTFLPYKDDTDNEIGF